MPRIAPLSAADASPEVTSTFAAIKSKLGGVPNIFMTMAAAPAVLNGYLAFSDATGKGKLSAKVREQIALVIANTNGCDYCASAHQAIGKMAGLSPEDVARALGGQGTDAKTTAALTFAKSVLADRGHVSDAALAAVRAAGWSDEEILEITANVALNVFTNYFNSVAGTDIDFPRISTNRAA